MFRSEFYALRMPAKADAGCKFDSGIPNTVMTAEAGKGYKHEKCRSVSA